MLPSCQIRTTNFCIHVEDGTTQAELMEVLSSYFPDCSVAVVPDTTVASVTEEDVLDRIGSGLLRTMTLDQKARAIEIVRRKLPIHDDTQDSIDTIIMNYWTDIVFGMEE